VMRAGFPCHPLLALSALIVRAARAIRCQRLRYRLVLIFLAHGQQLALAVIFLPRDLRLELVCKADAVRLALTVVIYARVFGLKLRVEALVVVSAFTVRRVRRSLCFVLVAPALEVRFTHSVTGMALASLHRATGVRPS
jgi:hypothetical protein